MKQETTGRRSPGGRAAGAGRRAAPKKSGGMAGKIFLALITFCNLLLSLLLAVQRRQDTLRAVREDEKVKVLLTAQKETKT